MTEASVFSSPARSINHVQGAEKNVPPIRFFGLVLQLAILADAFYDAVEFLKPEFLTANFYFTDLVLSFVYVLWLFQMIFGRARLPAFSRYKSLYFFIFVLLVPIVVGLAEGHVWQTVLRDARAPYYFVLSLAVISFVQDEQAMRKLLVTFLVVGTVSLAWAYVVWTFKIPVSTSLGYQLLTTGRVTRHFGYHSSHVLLLVCVLLLVNYLFLPGGKGSTKVEAIVGALLFAVGLALTLIRGLFIGMIFGLVVTVLIQKGKARAVVLLFLCLFVGITALLVHISSPDTIREIEKMPLVERYVSIVDPSVTTKESQDSAEGRLTGIGAAAKRIETQPLLGAGYGERRRAVNEKDIVDPIYSVVVHSSMSWMLYRTGYVGSIFLVVCLLTFFVRGIKSFMVSGNDRLRRFGYGTACTSFVAICIASAGGNILYGSDRFSSLFAIVLGLLLSRPRHVGNNVLSERLPGELKRAHA
jgi:hypothetical protein